MKLRNIDLASLEDSRGMTMLEVMVAATLILIIFYGLTMVYTRGRTQVDFEEDRRKATAVAQERMDWLRRDFRYDDLGALDTTDTTFVVDDRSFLVTHNMTVASPESLATTVALTVTWDADVAGTAVPRSLTTTTILARGMP